MALDLLVATVWEYKVVEIIVNGGSTAGSLTTAFEAAADGWEYVRDFAVQGQSGLYLFRRAVTHIEA